MMAEPVLKAVSEVRNCYSGDDSLVTHGSYVILSAAREKIMNRARFSFVGPEQLTVQHSDGTQSLVRELVYGNVASARPWKPNVYNSEVGLIVNKMNAVVGTVTSHVAATILNTLGEEAYNHFHRTMDADLGAARELLTEPREVTPFHFSKNFSDLLTSALTPTVASESTPAVEAAIVEETEQ